MCVRETEKEIWLLSTGKGGQWGRRRILKALLRSRSCVRPLFLLTLGSFVTKSTRCNNRCCAKSAIRGLLLPLPSNDDDVAGGGLLTVAAFGGAGGGEATTGGGVDFFTTGAGGGLDDEATFIVVVVEEVSPPVAPSASAAAAAAAACWASNA